MTNDIILRCIGRGLVSMAFYCSKTPKFLKMQWELQLHGPFFGGAVFGDEKTGVFKEKAYNVFCR